jgi:hypothetical protein
VVLTASSRRLHCPVLLIAHSQGLQGCGCAVPVLAEIFHTDRHCTATAAATSVFEVHPCILHLSLSAPPLLYQSSNSSQCTAAIEALMVLARVANFFTNGDSTTDLTDGSRRNVANTAQTMELPMEDTRRGAMEDEVDEEAARPPYLHVRMPSLQR